MSGKRDVIEESERMFRSYMTPDEIAYADSLTGYDRHYFWAMLYYTVKHDLEKDYIHKLSEAIHRVVAESDELSATPFRDAEEAISPHGWFCGNAVKVYERRKA